MNKFYVLILLTVNLSTVLKADALWTSSVAGKGRDTVTSISANKELVCIAGNSQGGVLQYSGISAEGQKKIASHEAKVDEKSAVLVCTSITGELKNLNYFVGTGLVQINDLAVTRKGEIYLAGYFANQFKLPNKLGLQASTSTTTITGENGIDGFVAKYDNKGVLQWTRTMTNQTGVQVWQISATEHQQPGILLQGTFNDSVTLPHGVNIKGSASKNHFIAKLNDQGEVTWHRQWAAERGKVVIGGVTADKLFAYESFAHENPVVDSNKASEIVLVKRRLDDGNVVWEKRLAANGSSFVTKPVIQQSGDISVGITFQNALNHSDFKQSMKSLGHSDLMLLTVNSIEGQTIDYFQFGDQGSEAVVELSAESEGNGLLFSYYQILPKEQKVNYAMGLYDRHNQVNKILPAPKFLSRDYSVQSQVLLDNEIITTGVVFRKKGQNYNEKGKVNSVKKSDMYINVTQLSE